MVRGSEIDLPSQVFDHSVYFLAVGCNQNTVYLRSGTSPFENMPNQCFAVDVCHHFIRQTRRPQTGWNHNHKFHKILMRHQNGFFEGH